MPFRRTYPARPLLGVGIVVMRRDKVLLIKRGHQPMRGLWTLPGGLVEIGESLRAAAAREVCEETGLAVTVREVVTIFESILRDARRRPRYHFVIVDFLARCPARAVPHAAGDAAAVAWVGPRELARYPLTPGLRQVLARARVLGRRAAPRERRAAARPTR